MPPTTSFDFGDVVLVPFPFTSQAVTKRRPAVVVSSPTYNARRPDVVVMAVSSQVRTPLGFAETAIASWKNAGLIAPSVVKPLVATMEKGLILKVLGRLEPQDRLAVERTLRSFLSST
jgi:mRNA interferase MazF